MVVHDIDSLLEELKQYPAEDVYVIGGESVYRALLPYCDKAYVTRIDHAYLADTYFPNLDEDPEWKMTKVSDEQTYFDLEYVFTIYGTGIENMKILTITAQKPHSTGSGFYLTEMVKGFATLGHEQAVLAGVYREGTGGFSDRTSVLSGIF